ncbi:hypothetical protein QYF36_010850 [Acer negundo]|nr:hypothetical protein QYF36_010850 [Acer negundo]
MSYGWGNIHDQESLMKPFYVPKGGRKQRSYIIIAVGFSTDGVPNLALIVEDDIVGHRAKRARAEFGSSALKCDPDISAAHIHDELMDKDKELKEEDGS